MKQIIYGIIAALLVLFGMWIQSAKQPSGYNTAHFENGKIIAKSRTTFDVQFYKDGVELNADTLSEDMINLFEYDYRVRGPLGITGRKCKGYWLWYKHTLVDSLIW